VSCFPRQSFGLGAWLAAYLLICPSATNGEEHDLAKISATVKAYQLSIETIELTTSSRVEYESHHRAIAEKDATAWGPDAIMRQEFCDGSAGRRYFRMTVERHGEWLAHSEDYKDQDVAYKVERSFLDPTVITGIQILRNHRFEKSRLGAPPEMLMGLITVDGRQLHEALRAPETRLVGLADVDGVSCYEVRVQNSAGMSRNVVYYLDPTYDFLCRKVDDYTATNEFVGSWRTTEFMRVSARWFPCKVVRDVVENVNGKLKVVSHFLTEIEDIKINHNIEGGRFRPTIPDGAVVYDETKGEPTSYVQGGTKAAEEVAAKLAALAKKDQNRSGAEKRVIVQNNRNRWLVWTTSLIALGSGIALFAAVWIKLRG